MVWDVRALKRVLTLSGHWGHVTGVAISSDGSTALSSSADDVVKIWDCKKGQLIADLIGHSDEVTAVAVNSTCTVAVSSSDDHQIKVWQVSTAKSIDERTQRIRWIGSLVLSGDSRVAVATTILGVHVLNPADGKSIAEQRYEKPPDGVDVSRDGSRAVFIQDKSIVIWNVSLRKEERRLYPSSEVRQVRFFLSSRSLVSVDYDEEVVL
jgi:WD40 repeat protein